MVLKPDTSAKRRDHKRSKGASEKPGKRHKFLNQMDEELKDPMDE
jgi:hypothetical protein